MKYCIVILDGLADRLYQRLNNLSPVASAKVLAMNKIAGEGRLGLVKTIPDELPCESLVAVMNILGLDPLMYYTGQAAFETLALDVELGPQDWACCCDFVSIFSDTLMDPQAGHIRTEEAELLLFELARQFHKQDIQFYCIKSYHHLAVITGQDLSNLKTTPPHQIIGLPIEKYYPTGNYSDLFVHWIKQSQIILKNQEVNQVRRDLHENPADSIWLWGHGRLAPLPQFSDLYHLKAGIISADLGIQGMAMSAGIKVIDVPEITGSWDTNYTNKKDYAISALQQLDLVVIHVNAAASAARYGDLIQKVRVLEDIDNFLIGPILTELEEDYRLLLVAGHHVSVSDKMGHHNPVPFAIYGPYVPGGIGLAFTEENAEKVDLLISNGSDLLRFFIQS